VKVANGFSKRMDMGRRLLSGREAMGRMKENPFDIVLTDL
jgi:hypothetical protein